MTEAAIRTGARRWLVRESLGVLSVGVMLLWPAGRWDWTAAWVLTGIYATWIAGTAALILPRDPALLAERVARRPELGWDRAILGCVGVLTMGCYVVAGLDVRYGWSPSMPGWLQALGGVTAAAGYCLVTWSMTENPFFTTVSRIQHERGQIVATGGPYALVRHPGYLGAAAFAVSAPFLLGSWIATPLGLATGILLVVRTSCEDRLLTGGLKGYGEYSARVHWRLLPGVW